VREAGQTGGPRTFLELRNLDADEESDAESESRRTQVDLGTVVGDKNMNTVQDAGGAADEASQRDEEDKLQSSLPEAHVPLGLIADLSLSNSKANRKKEGKLNEDDLNDDNVVCGLFIGGVFLSSWFRTDGLFFMGIGCGERNILHAGFVFSRHWECHHLINLFFYPGPATDLGIRATLIEQHSAPEILVHGLVKPEDVEKLFEMYVLLALILRVLIS